jgi:Group XII secretory phospholipase A2 precursor (PLA2G12)
VASPVNGTMPVVTRDDWFDRLARRAGGEGVTRRDAVGLFAGTTAAAILGLLIKPGTAFGATHTQGKDPGCSGTRKPYREGCARPIPKRNYTPAENGCGPQKGFDPVPDQPLNLANFNTACNGHDRGYGTCNVPKKVTDMLFLAAMVQTCQREYPSTGFWGSTSLAQCVRNAEIYHRGVSELGDDPYKEGQSEGCDCCEECPGDTIKCNGQCCPPAGKYVCGSSGLCCADCQPGWIKCPYPANARCGFGCCMPGSPICCPGMQPGSLRCCNGKCYKGGCG